MKWTKKDEEKWIFFIEKTYFSINYMNKFLVKSVDFQNLFLKEEFRTPN